MDRRNGASRPIIAIAAIIIVTSGPARTAEVSWKKLIAEMADLERLASFPEPAHVTRQASSYDRASRSPAEGESWFANADQGKYLREEERQGKKELVMMEAEGPGAIVRIWSADPKGTLRIYIDGGERPALEAPMADLLTGKVKPFVPPFAGERSRGANLHFPIPYRKSCKVTSDEGPFYYQVGYRTYPADSAVESFSPAGLAALQREIDRAAEALSTPDAPPRGKVSNQGYFATSIPPGESRRLFQVDKGGAIRELRLGLGRDPSPEVLRGCLLIARFDNEERPSILAPLGDFFGSAPGLNPYSTLPLSVHANGEMVSRWVMPFERGAVFEVKNTTAAEVSPRGSWGLGPFAWNERSLRFHARYRSEFDMPTRPMRDWSFVEVEGKGIFVGDALSVANPVKAWWGEGDEKIYVDGEAFPGHFGTGTEDYYGFAWCSSKPFQHAYHAQTRCDGPANYGHASMNRWHVIDDIPFTRSLRFDMEVWHWNAACKVGYAAMAYWYARPGATDSSPDELGPAALKVPEVPRWEPLRVEGAQEGEALNVLAKTGTAERQPTETYDGRWSRDAQLWWRGAKPGDELQLEFHAPAGRRRVVVALTRALDYGIHQLSVNGEKAGEPIDLFHRGVVPTGPLDLGVFELKAGPNVLGVKAAGTNPEAEPKAHMFGLDYVLVQPE